MDEVERVMEDVLTGNPEMTFSEVAAELVKKGELEFVLLEDPYVHAWLYTRYAGAKARVNAGRTNTDI